jgi:hypothetical protein
MHGLWNMRSGYVSVHPFLFFCHLPKNLTSVGYIVTLTTPTYAQFHYLCIISLVHVSALSPSSERLIQTLIKIYILFFLVLNFGVSSLKVATTPNHVSKVVERIHRFYSDPFTGVARVLMYHTARNERSEECWLYFGVGSRPLF